jgi:hypothetical protein
MDHEDDCMVRFVAGIVFAICFNIFLSQVAEDDGSTLLSWAAAKLFLNIFIGGIAFAIGVAGLPDEFTRARR